MIKIKMTTGLVPTFQYNIDVAEEDFEKAAKDVGYKIEKKPAEFERPKSGLTLYGGGRILETCDMDYYGMFNIFPDGTDMERIKGYIQRTFAICLACELVNAESGFVPDWDDVTQDKYTIGKELCGWLYMVLKITMYGCGAAVGSKKDAEEVCKLLTAWGV